MFKRLKKSILLLAFFGISVAKAAPQITTFSTGPLTGGKILVSQTNPTTQYFTVKITRYLDGGSYEGVNLDFQIIYQNGTTVEELTPEINVTTLDFGGSTEYQLTSYAVTIPAGKVGGYIQIRYYYTDMHTGEYLGPQFSTTVYYTTDVAAPPPSGQYEGKFYRDRSTDKVYWVLDDTHHHIETLATLKGCWDKYFSNSYNNIPTYPSAPQPIGFPLTPNTSILRHRPSMRIYFQYGNTLRYIPSIAVKDKYHFTFNYLRETYDISGYIIGPDLK